MTSITLAYPDIALVSDIEGTRQEIRVLQAAPLTKAYAQATVQFEGYALPHLYRGESKSRQWSMQAFFSHDEHYRLVALEALFERAALDDPDGRLLLRTNLGLVGGLDEVEAITVADVTRTALETLHYTLTWTATAVHWSPEV